jgi:hypothetical protein
VRHETGRGDHRLAAFVADGILDVAWCATHGNVECGCVNSAVGYTRESVRAVIRKYGRVA